QKMKRGPLVRLHPKTVLPVTFFWPGPAHSVPPPLSLRSFFFVLRSKRVAEALAHKAAMVVREIFQVKLIYKSYFHAKWKSKAMQPCSPSSSRASPLHLTYKRRVGGQLAERCVACEPG